LRSGRILSNITSGVILFFPFKMGDTIKIHDKDFPMADVGHEPFMCPLITEER
jgi:hypothetical protein